LVIACGDCLLFAAFCRLQFFTLQNGEKQRSFYYVTLLSMMRIIYNFKQASESEVRTNKI